MTTIDNSTLANLARGITAPMWEQAVRNGLHPIILKTNVFSGEGKNPINVKIDQISNKDKWTINGKYKGDFKNHNVGLMCGKESGIIVIDVDTKDSGLNQWRKILLDGNFQSIEEFHEKFNTPIVSTPSGGFHYYFKYNEDDYERYKTKIDEYPSIDIQCNGKYITYPGSVYMSCRPNKEGGQKHKCSDSVFHSDECLFRGKKYEWIKSIDDHKPVEIPSFLTRHLFKIVNPTYKKTECYQSISPEIIDEIIPHLASLATNFIDWQQTIWCLTSLGCTLDQVKQFASLDTEKYDEESTVKLYNEGSKLKWNISGLRSLCKRAGMNSEVYDKIFSKLKSSTDDYLLKKGDKGLAQLFVYNINKNEVIVSDTVKKTGFIWDNNTKLFKESDYPHFYKIVSDKLDPLVENKLKAAYLEQKKITDKLNNLDEDDEEKKLVKLQLKKCIEQIELLITVHLKVCSTNGQANIFSQALTILEIEDISSQMNTCIHQLPIKNGKLIDFKLGICRDRTPDDKWSFFCDVDFIPNEDLSFAREYFLSLTRVAGETTNRLDYYNYMVKVLGYCLTGETIDKSFFILNGDGNNGKSLLMNIMSKILKRFYTVGNESLILKSTKDRAGSPSSEKLALLNTRVVSISEPDDSKPISNSQVKNLTGDEEITARGVYERREITFKPTCKFFVLCNNKPELKVEKAMEARIKFMPFANRFKKDQKYVDLLYKNIDSVFTLLSLAAFEWYKNSELVMPSCCVQATQELLNENDSIQQFLDEHIIFDASEKISSSELYSKHYSYCSSRQLPILNKSEFKRLMEEKGYKSVKNSSMVYKGMKYVHSKSIDELQEEDSTEIIIEEETPIRLINHIVQPIIQEEQESINKDTCQYDDCKGECKKKQCTLDHSNITTFNLMSNYDSYCTLCHKKSKY